MFENDQKVVPIVGLQVSTAKELLSFADIGSNNEQMLAKRDIYGINEINVQVPSIPAIFYYEVFNPFYVFQLFSYILWMCEEYAFYATTILIITLISIILLIHDIFTQRKRLNKIVSKHNARRATCWREEKWMEIDARDLVPGDILQIFAGRSIVPADCVIVHGELVVDEAMLTGESVPATKLPLRENRSVLFNYDDSSIHLLHAGTEVVQTRSKDGLCKSIVVRTGFNTSRGSLVRAILFPKPIDMKFEHDGLRFVGVMAMIAVIGFIYTIVTQHFGCLGVGQVVVKALDLVTITVPPGLPMALAIGIVYAQRRLVRQRIFSISPKRINLAGGVNLALFDKTGTLTDNGLVFGGLVENSDKFEDQKITTDIASTATVMEYAMAACHTLAIIENDIIGDPLDVEIFKATGWQLALTSAEATTYVESVVKGRKLYQTKTFPFTSETARQSVIATDKDSNYIFTKGAPEIIETLSLPETIPTDYYKKLHALTNSGLRVIAIAAKTVYEPMGWVLLFKFLSYTSVCDNF